MGLLLALMFYIYGVAGVQLFRKADAGRFGSLKDQAAKLKRRLANQPDRPGEGSFG